MFQRCTAAQVAEMFGQFNFQNVLRFMESSEWDAYGCAPESVTELVDVCVDLLNCLLDDDSRACAESGGFKVSRKNCDNQTLYKLAFSYEVYSGLGKVVA